MFKSFILVFIGGGIGSGLRYLFYVLVNTPQIKWTPTLLINLLGCLLLGILFGLKDLHNISASTYMMLGVGFCGGLTTFSTFSLELVQLLRQGATLQALFYIGISLFIGLLLVYAGYRAVSHLQ